MILPKIVYLDTAKESLFKTKIEKAWIFALFCRLVAVYLIGKLSCWQNDCNIMRIMLQHPRNQTSQYTHEEDIFYVDRRENENGPGQGQ